ncbi:phosphohydrolase [Candidatus Kuenenbacteria bacterium HGW-Kuenenbacteria-1]|uniref:Phosphohydrolase n=1 Tax=Candidatus Kuenenbacteria bacterium HGW-Kuenenbacteria-1 TaxID=2013812 RepID=A0A2N1UN76_9BACT|nr:MAG: phosphohydrolase [Candidatus Kuenenbacteria bacterium HGW-Kuenenbacteria-1]
MNHIIRVYNLALNIAKHESNVDMDILQPAILLHDIGGHKEMSDPSGKTDHAIESAKMAEPILKNLNFTVEQIKHIQDCIISHRYKTENKPKTIEAKILFDSDKLDAIGAIGVARAFCWIGKNNANIYKKVNLDEYIKENMNGKTNGRIQDKTKHSPQIEFEVKTKFIIDKLFTKTAKEICKERILFFENFLNRMEREINGGL